MSDINSMDMQEQVAAIRDAAKRPPLYQHLAMTRQDMREDAARTQPNLTINYAIEGSAAVSTGDRAIQASTIIQEALRNVINHSGATRAEVRALVDEDGLMVVEIEDNGRGFDYRLFDHRFGSEPGQDDLRFGIVIMRERAELLGGSLEIGPANLTGSGSPGTLVRAHLPVGS